MKIKHIKTYLIHGQIDSTDTYEIVVNKDKLKQYKIDNDINMSLQEMLEDESPLKFKKSYFNNSVSFKLIKANELDDNYDNNDKELLSENIEVI